MELSIKNVGMIKEALIEMKGITIVAGENNSGKSTIGKALYCLFNSFYQLDKQNKAERVSYISRVIDKTFKGLDEQKLFASSEIAIAIMENQEVYKKDVSLLQSDLRTFLIRISPSFVISLYKAKLDRITENILSILNISDEELFLTILKQKMQAEFNLQLNNLNHPDQESVIGLKLADSQAKISVKNNESLATSKPVHVTTEAIYIDDPYALDDIHYSLTLMQQNTNIYSHREHLRNCLYNPEKVSPVKEALDEIIATKKLEAVYKKMNTVCSGEMVSKSSRSFAYKEKSGILIDIANVSTGMKTFAIIKTLLQNGCLEENGVLILDEPEIHLHPEWQLLFAEIIVLIQKEFDMYILMNTHSPYFLNAIEVFSRKHNIANKCKYYLADVCNGDSVFQDVTDKLETIYEKLARPLQELEDV